MRNAECGVDRTVVVRSGQRRGSKPARYTPHSALHTPHWRRGGVSYRVGVDGGGTFTDLVALGVDGTLEVRKVTTTPEDPAVGLFRAVDGFTGTGEGGRETGRSGADSRFPRPSPPVPIDLLVHGTTIATNALLERRGARVALVTTLGFEDLLWLRRQERASLYDLARLDAPGRGRRIGGLRIMTSSGGSLAPAAAARHAASLALSGPAGGVVGARLVGAAVGVSDLLAIDMGGTSADASLVTAAEALTEGTGSVAGVALALPSILIETVSAGGGSVAWVDEGGALKVGPESAGAVPGPACYGRGGDRPTVTDACLLLGWLGARRPLSDQFRLYPPPAPRPVAAARSTAGPHP